MVITRTMSLCSSSLRHASILQTARFRRDPRDMEEEEELWFDQDEDAEDSEAVVPVVDSAFRSAKIVIDQDMDVVDSDMEDMGRIIGNKKGRHYNGWLLSKGTSRRLLFELLEGHQLNVRLTLFHFRDKKMISSMG